MRNETGRCSIGEYLARRLEQAGVRHDFTVPGDFNLVLLDQLLKNPRQVQSVLGGQSAMLVETGDSWFNGLKVRLPQGCRFEIQFQAGSIG